MPDWRSSMQRTYEYYIVDPGTWKDMRLISDVESSIINRDAEAETRGSANIDLAESLGECYIRIYMITIQNGIREKHPLGTFLIQTPSSNFNGKIRKVSVDAYTPLIELKENPPPLGYSVLKGTNIMRTAYLVCRDHARAPVVETSSSDVLPYDFVANTNDTWLSFGSDLASNAKYDIDVDEMGQIIFPPKQDTASLQPVWTYDDGNSSILYPELTMDHDLYGVPNAVEIIYTNGFYDDETGETRYSLKITNDDPNSQISTVRRGREILHRAVNPNIAGNDVIVTSRAVHNYAESLLRALSSVEYTISYTHGYCPVRVGDCVRLNYEAAGLVNVKAKVISQSIRCTPDCPVTEKAVFTTKLWG